MNRSNTAVKTFARLSPALLVLAAGSAANAQFVFSPACPVGNPNANWYQECTGAPCGGGGFQTFNQWGQSGCAGGLPTPGPGSTATVSGGCTMNGAVSVANIFSNAGTSMLINSGLTVGQPCTLNGVWDQGGGNNVLTGNFSVAGTFAFTVGFSTTLVGGITNNGVLALQQRTIAGGGTATIVNNNDLLKVVGGDVGLSGVLLTNNDLVRSDAGRLFVDNSSVTGGNGSVWSTPGGQLYFRASTLRGRYAGEATSLWRLESCSVDADSEFLIGGNGIDVNGNFSIAPGSTLTNGGLLVNPNGNNTFTGDIDNSGVFRHLTGWNTTITNGVWVNLPGGLIDLQQRTFSNGGGSSIINQGQFVKSVSSDGSINGIPYSSTGVTRVDAGRLFLDSTSVTGGAGSSWSTPGGQLQFRGSTLRGNFAGSAGGLWRLESCSFDDDTTLAVSGGGVDINGNMTVAAGKTLTNAGLIHNVQGNNQFVGTFTNTGTAVFDTGWNTILNGSVFTNAMGATLNLVSRSVTPSGTGSGVVNAGTVVKSGPSDASFTNLPVSNTGLVRVDQGRLFFDGCGVTAGGASAFNLTGGQLQFRGSTLRGPINSNNAGFMRLENCTFDQPSSINVTLTPADLNGNLTNTSGVPLVNTGGLNNVQGNNQIQGDLTNSGTLLMDTGWNTSLNDCDFVNTPSGTVNLVSRTFSNSATSSVVNNGQISKASSSDVAFTNLPIQNNASVDVSAGRLFFNGGSVGSTPAASWDLTGGQLLFVGATMSGTFNSANSGFVRLQSVAFNQDSVLNVTGNPADVNGNIDVADGFTMTNAGLLNNVQGNNGFSGTIVNTGTFTHDTGWNTTIAGTVTNGSSGTMDLRSRTFSGPGQVVNNGLMLKGGPSDVQFNVPVVNNARATADGGRLFFNNALTLSSTGVVTANSQVFLPNDFALTTGLLEGTGLYGNGTSIVASGGRINPGNAGTTTGTLAMNGNLVMQTGGRVSIDIAGPSQADRLNLVQGFPRGVAVLNGHGSVEVNRIGGYTPVPGARWTIMSFRERQGQFGGVIASNPTPNIGYRLIYTATTIDLLTLTGCGLADVGSQGGVAGGDGILDNNDFIVFIDKFFSGDAIADLGATGGVPGTDGLFNNNDFIVYIDAFFFGCAS